MTHKKTGLNIRALKANNQARNTMYREALTTNRLLIEAFKAGNLEDVAEDLLRYHKLQKDFQIEVGGNFYREREIHVEHGKVSLYGTQP